VFGPALPNPVEFTEEVWLEWQQVMLVLEEDDARAEAVTVATANAEAVAAAEAAKEEAENAAAAERGFTAREEEVQKAVLAAEAANEARTAAVARAAAAANKAAAAAAAAQAASVDAGVRGLREKERTPRRASTTPNPRMRQWRLLNPRVGREGRANPGTFILAIFW